MTEYLIGPASPVKTLPGLSGEGFEAPENAVEQMNARDVLTAILVRFEWHDDCPRVRNRAALLYRPLLARQDQSMQLGVPGRIGIELPLSVTDAKAANPPAAAIVGNISSTSGRR